MCNMCQHKKTCFLKSQTFKLHTVQSLVAIYRIHCAIPSSYIQNKYFISKLTEGPLSACSEGVPNVILDAGTWRHMVSDSAQGIDTAGSRTRINALVVPTCFVRRTVWVDHTFWPTCNVRIAKVFRNALAGRGTVSVLTECIGTTRRRVAGIDNLSDNWWSYE